MSKKGVNSVSKFKVGDVIAMTHYARITNIDVDPKDKQDRITVDDLERAGTAFHVKGDDLFNSLQSAAFYSKTEKVSQTEIAEKLSQAYGKPFTVTFLKADKKERVLVGKLISHEPLMGRSHVHDFEVTSGTPLRLVDHRTIKSLIIDGVKYEVKS